LRRQLLPELARKAQLELADLQSLWGEKPSTPKAPERQGPLRLFRRGSIRVPPAGPADVAVRLLLQHSDWWHQLTGDDKQMLHELGGVHGDVIRWLEHQIEHHDALPWASLNEAMDAEPWAESARTWVRAGLGDEEYRLEGLQQIVARLWHELLKQEADAIVALAPTGEDLQRYKAIMDQIAAIKSARHLQSK